MKIAYLSNPYPAISHTFILREIESLRQEGFTIYPVSVSPSPDLHKMTVLEKEEAERTLVMKQTSLLKILRLTAGLLIRSPAGFAKMAVKALSLCFTGPKNPVKAAGYLAEAVILLGYLHENSISHIHEHFANPTAFVALLAHIYDGVDYSLSIHGPDVFYQVDSSSLAEKVEHAAFVRCISHYCRSQLMRITEHEQWAKLHIVRCGVNAQLYKPRPDPANTTPVLLCVGRLCPAKGQHILLDGCLELKKRQIPYSMVFVGDGPDRESLENLCSQLGLNDQVVFTGSLGQDQVRSHYAGADIFVLPSFAEGVPVVLMEAMAMEIAVVSTRITGIPELIDHGRTGLLATPGDVDDLVEQLIRLIENVDLRLSLGKAGRQTVIELYSQGSNNHELAQLFKQYGGPHAS